MSFGAISEKTLPGQTTDTVNDYLPLFGLPVIGEKGNAHMAL